jgi:hypothetical protein
VGGRSRSLGDVGHELIGRGNSWAIFLGDKRLKASKEAAFDFAGKIDIGIVLSVGFEIWLRANGDAALGFAVRASSRYDIDQHYFPMRAIIGVSHERTIQQY